MMPRPSALAVTLFVALTGTVIACGGDDDEGGSGGHSADGGGGDDSSCRGAFTFLQKDAYRATAGRSTDLWPPHTTTTLAWSCADGTEADSFQANHGTEPGATDANGDVFLVEAGRLAVEGSAADLTALSAAFDACACGTSFLSLDALEDDVVQDLVAELSQYILDNLTCAGDVDAQDLVDRLEQGQIESVIAALPNCTWSSGFDLEGGFDEALAATLSAVSETLADYHVCNNDAALQAKLVEGYVATGEVTACDGADALCSGPMWFFAP